MATEQKADTVWNYYVDVYPKKQKGVYVETQSGEIVGPLKVVGPIRVVCDEAGKVVETQIRGYGPDSIPHASGWIAYKGIHKGPVNKML